MRLKIRAMLLGAVTALGTLGLWSASAFADTTKILVEGTYPPWNFQTNDGKLTGFDLDLANEVCQRAKLTCEFSAQVWDSQIPSLLAGQFDAMMTVGATPKRRKVMSFSVPYAATPELFAALTGGPVSGLPHTGEKINASAHESAATMEALKEALAGKTVAVMGSTSLNDFLEKNFGSAITIRTYKSEPDMLLDLRSGRVDLVFDSSAFLRSALLKPENSDIFVAGPDISDDSLAIYISFGLRPDATELKGKLDTAIKSAIADGTVKKISMKWFGFDVSP